MDERPIEPIHFRPLPRKARPAVVGALVLAIAVVVVAAIVAAIVSPKTPKRTVTIPLADRTASAKLLAAAEAVGYRPSPHGDSIELAAASTAAPEAGGLLGDGSIAPPFSLKTPAGATVSLASLRGRAVLLEFFATWCPHCDAEAPHLRTLAATLAKDGVSVVSVNGDSENAASVYAYHVYFGLTFPALLDPGSQTVGWPASGPLGPVTKAYRVPGFPAFYVLDRHGVIVWRSLGEQPDAFLAQELRKAAAA